MEGWTRGAPSIRHESRPQARFYDECGAAPTPHTYTPRFLAEKILTTRSALEGELKVVTALFADVVDSSALAQQLDAEKLRASRSWDEARLNEALKSMMAAILPLLRAEPHHRRRYR